MSKEREREKERVKAYTSIFHIPCTSPIHIPLIIDGTQFLSVRTVVGKLQKNMTGYERHIGVADHELCSTCIMYVWSVRWCGSLVIGSHCHNRYNVQLQVSCWCLITYISTSSA